MLQSTPGQPRIPRVITAVAVIWCVGCALVFLMYYDGWMFPFHCLELASGTIPTLRIGPHFVSFWWQRTLDFLGVGLILVMAWGVGSVIVCRLSSKRDLVTALFALGVGLWALAVLVLLVASISVRAVPLVYLGLACWFLPEPRSFVRRARQTAPPWDGWSKLMLALLVVAALLYLPGVLSPPFEYDELEYHLGALAEYQRAGHIIFLPHNFYSNLPQQAEMLYLLASLTSSVVGAKILHWAMGLLAATAIGAVGMRLTDRRVGLTAAALFYCVPSVQDLSQTARIDLMTTFCGTLAFGGLLLWWQEKEMSRSGAWLWLSAWLAGEAVATKWPAFAVVAGPGVLFVLFVCRKPMLATAYGTVATFPVWPWMLKNWTLAGNPVYPLFCRLFPSPHWGAEQAATFAVKHYGVFGWSGLAAFVTKMSHYSFAEPLAIPLLFMTVPLILLLPAKDNRTKLAYRVLGLWTLAYTGWWLCTFRPYRFLFPALPLAALVGALGLLAIPNKWTARLPVLLTLFIGLTASAAVVLVDAEDYKRVPPRMNFLHLAAGEVSAEQFAQRMGGGMYEPLFWMNDHLAPDAKVLFIGEARIYYARQDVLWSTAFDQHPLTTMLTNAHDAALLHQRMRAAGITHVYVNRYEWQRLKQGYGYLAAANEQLLADFFNNHTVLLHQHGPCSVYELKN